MHASPPATLQNANSLIATIPDHHLGCLDLKPPSCFRQAHRSGWLALQLGARPARFMMRIAITFQPALAAARGHLWISLGADELIHDETLITVWT